MSRIELSKRCCRNWKYNFQLENCGQAYVALSRVTPLKGLNLINFDPYEIKANNIAIVEYKKK